MKVLTLLSLVVAVLCTGADLGSARTWRVASDGSGDAPTIQAGLDSSAVGDTVLVACGTYYESGIWMKSGVVLCSESGQADCATIDAQGVTLAIECVNCQEPTKIVGFTLKDGWLPWWEYGGGMFCTGCSALTVANCTFLNNHADFGGGLSCDYTALEVVGCTFAHNSAVSEGGGLFCMNYSSVHVVTCVFDTNLAGLGGAVACGSAMLSIERCTLHGNTAYANEEYGQPGGGGVWIYGQSSAVLENSIIASSAGGEGIWCLGTNIPEVRCCDIWGNADGDWVGCVAQQYGVDGNFSADPLFCNTPTGDFSVETCSPCLSGNHPDGYDCGTQVGAYLSGCECGAATEPTTWGAIKAMYR